MANRYFPKINIIKHNILRGLKGFRKKTFRKIFPLIYLYILIIGLILTFIYSFVHSLVICSAIFGEKFCTPAGVFIILLASLPGYIIAGNIFSFLSKLPWVVSFPIIILISFIFYFVFGIFIEKVKGKKLNSENLSKIIIVFGFLLFLLLYFVLSRN